MAANPATEAMIRKARAELLKYAFWSLYRGSQKPVENVAQVEVDQRGHRLISRLHQGAPSGTAPASLAVGLAAGSLGINVAPKTFADHRPGAPVRALLDMAEANALKRAQALQDAQAAKAKMELEAALPKDAPPAVTNAAVAGGGREVTKPAVEEEEAKILEALQAAKGKDVAVAAGGGDGRQVTKPAVEEEEAMKKLAAAKGKEVVDAPPAVTNAAVGADGGGGRQLTKPAVEEEEAMKKLAAKGKEVEDAPPAVTNAVVGADGGGGRQLTTAAEDEDLEKRKTAVLIAIVLLWYFLGGGGGGGAGAAAGQRR